MGRNAKVSQFSIPAQRQPRDDAKATTHNAGANWNVCDLRGGDGLSGLVARSSSGRTALLASLLLASLLGHCDESIGLFVCAVR